MSRSKSESARRDEVPLQEVRELHAQIQSECVGRNGEAEEDGFRTSRYTGRRLERLRQRHGRTGVGKRAKGTPRPGEMRLKEFLYSESKRAGASVSAIYGRLMHGHYPGVSRRKAGQYYAFVRVQELPAVVVMKSPRVKRARVAFVPHPLPGELWMKEFVALEAERLGENPHTIAMRLYRGRYEGVRLRRVNKRVVFVSREPITKDKLQIQNGDGNGREKAQKAQEFLTTDAHG